MAWVQLKKRTNREQRQPWRKSDSEIRPIGARSSLYKRYPLCLTSLCHRYSQGLRLVGEAEEGTILFAPTLFTRPPTHNTRTHYFIPEWRPSLAMFQASNTASRICTAPGLDIFMFSDIPRHTASITSLWCLPCRSAMAAEQYTQQTNFPVALSHFVM